MENKIQKLVEKTINLETTRVKIRHARRLLSDAAIELRQVLDEETRYLAKLEDFETDVNANILVTKAEEQAKRITAIDGVAIQLSYDLDTIATDIKGNVEGYISRKFGKLLEEANEL
jgi:hypothetical protein